MRKYSLLAALAPVMLSACYGGNHDYNYNGFPGPAANLQVLNASPDAPALTVLVDGQQWFGNLHYGEGTGELPIPAGSHTLSVQAQTPTGLVTVIAPTALNLQQNNDYVVAAEGAYASIGAEVFPHVLSTVAANATRIQFLNAAPAQAAIAVYLTVPGADLSAATPLGSGSVAYQAATGPTDVPSGQYEVRVTPAGAITPVLFDSGTISLVGGTDLVISALQNVGPGTAPIVLGVVDSSGDVSKLFDVSTPANVRVVNTSPDAPPLSVIANGNTASPVASGLAFEGFTPYIGQTPGLFTFTLAPSSNAAQAVASLQLEMDAGSEQTIYALGSYASMVAESTWDDRRRIATGAKLRIIQASPGAGAVDIYMTTPGTGIASAPPVYTGLPFIGDTGFQQFASGSFDLTVTTAGTQTILAGPTTLSVSNAGIYTVVVRDAPGGGAPYGFIPMDDFAP